VQTFEKPLEPPIEPRVRRVVDSVAAALVEKGAEAVVLVGSHTRREMQRPPRTSTSR